MSDAMNPLQAAEDVLAEYPGLSRHIRVPFETLLAHARTLEAELAHKTAVAEAYWAMIKSFKDEIAELRAASETAASALCHAADLIEKHVSPDALGFDSSGDLSEAHLTWSWPILDEHIHGIREVAAKARALAAPAGGASDE